MSAVAHPVGLDPLIAEAKERARRRRLLALGVLVVTAAAIGTTITLRSPARVNSLGICASPPSGWRERRIAARPSLPAAVLLTNFRFGVMGPMQDLYGIDIPGRSWPSDGVMIAVQISQSHLPDVRGRLHVGAAGFHSSPNGGSKRPTAFPRIRSNGQELAAFVQVASVTPATIAAANRALAGVQVCSA